jgi:hypothetical protein
MLRDLCCVTPCVAPVNGMTLSQDVVEAVQRQPEHRIVTTNTPILITVAVYRVRSVKCVRICASLDIALRYLSLLPQYLGLEKDELEGHMLADLYRV